MINLVLSYSTMPRCPNGTRKNKKTGECEAVAETPASIVEPSPVAVEPVASGNEFPPATDRLRTDVPSSRIRSSPKAKKCPKGTRKNKKTGDCESTKKEPTTEPLEEPKPEPKKKEEKPKEVTEKDLKKIKQFEDLIDKLNKLHENIIKSTVAALDTEKSGEDYNELLRKFLQKHLKANDWGDAYVNVRDNLEKNHKEISREHFYNFENIKEYLKETSDKLDSIHSKVIEIITNVKNGKKEKKELFDLFEYQWKYKTDVYELVHTKFVYKLNKDGHSETAAANMIKEFKKKAKNHHWIEKKPNSRLRDDFWYY
jgi:hypothetical protein